MRSIGLVLSVGVSLWFGIHWGIILGAIFVGVKAGYEVARPTSGLHPVMWQTQAIEDKWLVVYAVMICTVFGWQSALSSVIIGWFSSSIGIYITYRFVRKATKEEIAIEIDLEKKRWQPKKNGKKQPKVNTAKKTGSLSKRLNP